jgi:predicted amidohydrolase YtcJ
MYDLVLINGNVITMDPSTPLSGLVAVRGERIAIVSPATGRCVGPPPEATRTIDCAGKTVIPGFIDAHCHVGAYAQGLVSLGLSPRDGVDSMASIRERVRRFCEGKPPGTWVRGRGYDEFHLAEGRHPNRWDLDEAAPLHPVRLTHRSGHAVVLNSLALKEVGITSETGDPPEGYIDRDLGTGEPTGLLFGIGDFLARRIPPADAHEMGEALANASGKLLSLGITSVQDASAHNGLRQWRLFGEWKRRAIFAPRVTMMMGQEGFAEWRQEAYPVYTPEHQLRLGGVKIMVTEATGSLHPSPQILREMILSIDEAGLQAVVHAVEEPAIGAACDAIEHASYAHRSCGRRHRIEHCSVCPPSLMTRMGGLAITVVTQPTFIYYNGDRYLSTVPDEQQPYLYPIRSMLHSAIPVAFSSDFPISEPGPLQGICAAVTRETENGRTLLSEERVEAMEALRMHTSAAAEAAFEEDVKGSITPGKLADLVVLSEDPTKVDASRIKEIKVEMTILGGKVVWSGPCTGD